MSQGGDIYSATYSNVPVYELKVAGDHIMRRRSDDWVNATHILKIAGLDKPARTRVLERDVQKGVHEKIQGGYGKYQGTWIPLNDARALAQKYNVHDRISTIFNYVPGDRSPPPAPKHTTAASSRSKPAKQPVPARRQPVQQTGYYAPANPQEQHYQDESQIYEDETGRATPETASMFAGDDEFMQMSQNSNASRKRKRYEEEASASAADLEHTIYGDELLDYFVTAGDDPATSNIFPPVPPANFDVNRPIDSHGNNALHWACAMGDLQVTKDLLARGANPKAANFASGETPLMRAVLFTNNYDKQSFPKVVDLLAGSITERDRHGATVFHHIAETARSKSKWSCARYYCEVLINKMADMGFNFVQTVLLSTDENGDTPVLCAVRNGCIKVASLLLNHCPEAGSHSNLRGDSANELLMALREKKDSLEQLPSSPPRGSDSFTSSSRKRRHHKAAARQPLSRAATNVLARVGPLMETASGKLADMYDVEMREKETAISEAKVALADFETQRHKVRQETFALMARAEAEGFADDEAHKSELQGLHDDYGTLLGEAESLLEQQHHTLLHSTILTADQQTPAHAFRSANSDRPLSQEEARNALPWALQLHQEQTRRRALVSELARYIAEAGTSEMVGKCRKLVAIATGIREEELDQMSKELLDSLEGNGQASPMASFGEEVVVNVPQTPPRTVGGVA